MPIFNASDVTTARSRVAIVAAGIISPLGFGLTETLASLRANKDCVSPVTKFDVEKCRCKTAGQVPDEPVLSQQRNGRETQRLHRPTHTMIAALDAALQ